MAITPPSGRISCRRLADSPGGQRIGEWIDPAAFSIPAKATLGCRNIARPGLFQIDTAIARSIRVTERTNVSLRMEAFNVFNRPELGGFNRNLSSPTFGQILAVSNTVPIGTGLPRSVQFAERFMFYRGEGGRRQPPMSPTPLNLALALAVARK
jgi:hypothetical protein